MTERVRTGSEVIDRLLHGGYESDVITTIYGPAGSGKSNLCLISAISVAENKKVIFIDTEGGFSVERVKQLKNDFQSVLDNIIVLRPTRFSEQKESFSKLKNLVDNNLGLIIVDSIAMLYRLELGKSDDIYSVNRELGLQISYLSEIARKRKIPIIVTNQVYSDFDNRDQVKMVGGDLLKYGSKCIFEFQKFKNHRKAILKKHRSLPENLEVIFQIKEDGFVEVTPA